MFHSDGYVQIKVAAVFEDLQRRQIPPPGTLTRFSNGEQSFTIVDPAGTVLNIVDRHPPQAEPLQL